MPLQATSGAASYDAFGGGVAVVPQYIEDVFSTWLYTGNGATQTINNGIDLAGEGGLVWQKNRSAAGYDHVLTDTTTSGTGALTKFLSSNTTNSFASNQANIIGSYNSDGFTLNNGSGYSNNNGVTAVSWTFRKQPKFFDVVTWTGNGGSKTVSHSLGSVPGCVIVKNTAGGTGNGYWLVYHRSATGNLWLNTTGAQEASHKVTNLTATTFNITSDYNESGATYVAYLFAHNAGGFGLTGTDNVISCGSYTGDGSNGQSVTLGYEPQWLLIKRTDTANSWFLQDNMRPFSVTATEWLQPNTANAESAGGVAYVSPTATGFTFTSGGSSAYNASGGTYIYIAIRRGPMKVPTDGTKVFAPVNQTGGGTVTTNFPVDLLISTTPSQSAYRSVNDRLRGASTTSDVALYTNVTDAEAVGTGYGFGFDNNTGFKDANYSNSFTDVYWNFRRAPGFFDEVCYTGNSNDDATQAINHNLGAVPELIIVKRRSGAVSNWIVYSSTSGNGKALLLNNTNAEFNSNVWNSTSPTASVFTVGTPSSVNYVGSPYVAYLFASCPGVSKVGSYTGTGTTQTINCGFTAGARFVLIKRTDSTGDWYVWDSARGIVAGNDPYLLLNSTAAEVTNTDWVDTAATGFEVSNAGGNLVNISGATYVFLAIA